MQERKATYLSNITGTFSSLLKGLRLTLKHLRKATNSRTPVSVASPDYFLKTEGINTIQYPYEMQPVPDNGRYRLHNEIDDCIVCDKCAKVCPVNCITIEPVKAIETFGRTSDGTPKRIYAAKFDIDMGQCCFCGLCTTVCPTECLTMTKVYDFTVYDMDEHIYAFAEMTEEEIGQKKQALAEYQKSRPQGAQGSQSSSKDEGQATPPKPVFRPKIKPSGPPPPAT